MLVKDIMSEPASLIDPETSLAEVAKVMADANIGFLPVSDGVRIFGVLSDRDLVVNGLAMGRDASTPAREVMCHLVHACHGDDDVELVIRMMEREQVRRIVVTDSEDRPIGVVSLDDLAVKFPDEAKVGHTLHRIAERTLYTI